MAAEERGLFGAWLADQLRLRLERAGIVINREVRVRQTTTRHGHAVDVQADAPPIAGYQNEPAPCRIELKGNWNADLMTAMRTQLAKDYLIPEGSGMASTSRPGSTPTSGTIPPTAAAGPHAPGTATDRRRARCAGRDLRDLGLDVRSVVIYVPRPVKSARTERPAKSAGRGRARAKPGPPSSSG